ncbi:MAG: cation:proton antiporter [Pseudomonadales bacterium]|nr:cation:proton antiporter [Pseudomonadales bacterium]
MEFIWILFAFGCGLAVRLIALPPLVGYLCAGFMLHLLGVVPNAGLQVLADLGITLMLFTIGLKLDISSLLKPEIWVTSVVHFGSWILLITVLFLLLGLAGIPLLAGESPQTMALLGIALAFSSTVCIVKLLEESGEMKTRHGQIAIGVLVLQDVLAVLFLVVASGAVPSVWALALVLLYPLRKSVGMLLERAGHGELLPLTGFFLAFGAYELFTLVDLKGDLGALLAGMLLSKHPKATELTKSLLGFKDLFLIGFFLSIGFTALPDWSMLLMACALAMLLPFKFVMFYLIFYALRLRARSSFLASLSLTNFSEFGLIVLVICVQNAWLSEQWLVILAMAVSISFALTSVFYRLAHGIYRTYKADFRRFERDKRLPEDVFVQPAGAEILVIGMGRVGKGAYQSLFAASPGKVWGMDADSRRIAEQAAAGMYVFCGDGEDADLWEGLDHQSLKLILLALPSIEDNINITSQLNAAGYQGEIAAIARYEDEREALQQAGIGHVFNFYAEAGTGFAEESLALIAKPA